MRAFILCTLLVLATAQLIPKWDGSESDRHAGYTFELHDRGHVMIIRDDHNCYLIHTAEDFVNRFHDQKTQEILEDNVIRHIKDDKHLHKVTTLEALKEFHNIDVDAQCRQRAIFELPLKP